MIDFAAVVTPDSLSFVAPDGVSYSYQESMNEDVFAHACGHIRSIQKENDPDFKLQLIEELIAIISPARIIAKHGEGRITVSNGSVLFDGAVINNAITENILWGISEGYNVKPYMRFLEKLQDNPSKRAVDELFGFIQRHKLVIDEDGDILAYKKVRENFLDIHSGTVDNSVGRRVSVPRNTVDDDFGVLCSEGLHCCSWPYLPSYASAHNNRVLIIKIHPKDVVAIPSDGAAKMRVCEYLVLREIPYNHGETDTLTVDHLVTKPIWSHSDIHDSSNVVPGDTVRYVGLDVKYNLLNKDMEYVIKKVQDWGGVTYISLEDYPDNFFLFEEFEVTSTHDDRNSDDDWDYSDDNPDNWDDDENDGQ